MNNFQQRGLGMSIIAAAAIAAGQVIRVGNVLGVASHAAANGQPLEVKTDGVFVVPKVPGAVIAQGETLTWDAAAAAFDDNLAVPAVGDLTGASAYAFAAAGNGATFVTVKFTGVPGILAA